MENKDDVVVTEKIICDECQAKKEKVKEEQVVEKIEKKEEKKGLFKSGIIQRLVGFIVLFIITVSFIINSGSMVALLGLILLAFFYCSGKFLRDVINAFFEMIGSLVLGVIVFILIIYGICIIPISLSI